MAFQPITLVNDGWYMRDFPCPRLLFIASDDSSLGKVGDAAGDCQTTSLRFRVGTFKHLIEIEVNLY